MMKFVKLAPLALVVFASGCSTIKFTNGAAEGSEQYDQWHHNLAYSLYEYSPPVEPEKECTGTWSSVTVEKDVITAIAGSIDDVFGIDIWDPWAVSITCAK